MGIESIKMLTAEDLEPILGRKASTIRTDVRRRPSTLPPRFQVPGTKKLMWLESDVLAWVEQQRKFK